MIDLNTIIYSVFKVSFYGRRKKSQCRLLSPGIGQTLVSPHPKSPVGLECHLFTLPSESASTGGNHWKLQSLGPLPSCPDPPIFPSSPLLRPPTRHSQFQTLSPFLPFDSIFFYPTHLRILHLLALLHLRAWPYQRQIEGLLLDPPRSLLLGYGGLPSGCPAFCCLQSKA